MVERDDPKKETHRKPYERPTVTKLTPEQAKSKLLDLAHRGDQQAKELLQQLFPEEAAKISKSKKKSA